MPEKSEEKQQKQPVLLNSLQLNVVTVVDLHKALATGSLDGALYMMDNSQSKQGQGSADLQTTCKQGQVINWLIYPMDMQQRADGTWPPMPLIKNIVFLQNGQGDQADVAEFKICTEFKIYGAPDLIRSRSPSTPVYYYWAGAILSSLYPGVYYYRFIIELEQEGSKGTVCLNSSGKSSLNVIEI